MMVKKKDDMVHQGYTVAVLPSAFSPDDRSVIAEMAMAVMVSSDAIDSQLRPTGGASV
jgi:hypothetical protein